jgi:hypothetical protein
MSSTETINRRELRKKEYERIFIAAEAHGPEMLREALRELCRSDLFYLLVKACGRTDTDRNDMRAKLACR